MPTVLGEPDQGVDPALVRDRAKGDVGLVAVTDGVGLGLGDQAAVSWSTTEEWTR